MAYNSNYWKTGDIIASAKLNNIETGISDSVVDNQNGTITVNGDIIDVQSLLNINLDDYYTKEQVDQQLPLKPGPKGTSITGISQTYQLSDSETIVPTGTWSTAIQTPTDELPYLWVQNIFLTNDSSNIVLTYVCPVGKTGATGPQGETGQGIDIKGYYESSSSLPTTGTNGDCYIIGYDLYVYMNGSYTDVGQLTADSSNFVDTTALNAGLATKVTDNKNGTEQLNGVQVQPFNKLSDTIGGRNLVKDSEQELTGKAYDFYGYHLASLTELTPGKTYTMSFSAKVDDKAVNCNQRLFVDIYDLSWSFSMTAFVPISTDYQRVTSTFTCPEGQTGISYITAYLEHPVINGNSDSTADKSDAAGTGYIKEFKLEQGSIATDWTPAPEDKVNVSDMRKPASDVAGIDETVIDNHDNTITANGASYDLSKSGLAPLQLVSSGSFNDLPLGTVLIDGTVTTDGPDDLHGFTTTTFYFAQWTGRKAQIAIADNTNLMFFRIFNANAWKSWTKLTDDSTVVHTSDMRKPASDVAGIDEVNAKQDKLTITPADDSKVVHNTGTEEITGTKTFDTAPIDKTTGNPYITKDGVPTASSTLADTTKLSNFTAGLQLNGTSVATSTDLANLIKTNGYTNIADGTDLNTLTTDGLYIYDSAYYTDNINGVTNYYHSTYKPFILDVSGTGTHQAVYPLQGMGKATRTYSSSSSAWGSWAYSTVLPVASYSDNIELLLSDSSNGVNNKAATFYNSDVTVAVNQSTGDLNSFNSSGVFMQKATYYTNGPFTSPDSTDYMMIKVWAVSNMIVQEASLFSDLSTIKRRSSVDTGSTWTAWA